MLPSFIVILFPYKIDDVAPTITSMVVSVFLLAKAVETLPIGTAYAIWVGIGACGTALFGIIGLQEAVSPLRLFFLLLLIVSIVGLKVSSTS